MMRITRVRLALRGFKGVGADAIAACASDSSRVPARDCLRGCLSGTDDRCVGRQESLPDMRQLSGICGGPRRG
eukprot:2999545-Pyramimonas_sp.AAC.1